MGRINVLMKMLIIIIIIVFVVVAVGVHGNNLFPPSPSPSPLSGQEDIVKQFDLQCYVKWARKCWIFLGSSLEFQWFEGCLDAAKIQCAAPFLSQKLPMHD
jgi:hypothetical protein